MGPDYPQTEQTIIEEQWKRFNALALEVAGFLQSRPQDEHLSIAVQDAQIHQKVERLRALADEIVHGIKPVASAKAQVPERTQILEPVIDELIAKNPGLKSGLMLLKDVGALNIYLN
jgi:hypothetical protein